MKRRYSLVTAIVVIIAAMLITGCSAGTGGNQDGTYNFKIGHVTKESHIWHQTALKFGEELEKLSDGRMTVTVYPSSQLGLEKDMVQQLETGSIDFGFLTNGYMSTRQESLNAWFLPFVFNSLEDAVKLRESKPVKEMLAELESQGLIGLDFIFAGNRHVLLRNGHISSMKDLSGKKIRIIGSPVFQTFWDRTGAGPTAMPLSEVYTSLQTGVIDGMDIDLDALVTEKYYETAKYLTLTNHATFPAVIVMGKKSFESLSPEDQEIVKEAMKTAVDWGVKESLKREKENLDTVKKAGVKVQKLKDVSSFEEVRANVINTFSEKSPIIKEFLQEIE